MDKNQFVSALGLVVEESAIKGVVENLKYPPGRAPSQEMGLLGHWSNHKKYTNEIDN